MVSSPAVLQESCLQQAQVFLSTVNPESELPIHLMIDRLLDTSHSLYSKSSPCVSPLFSKAVVTFYISMFLLVFQDCFTVAQLS